MVISSTVESYQERLPSYEGSGLKFRAGQPILRGQSLPSYEGSGLKLVGGDEP